MEADENKEGISYVPDDSEQDADESKAREKSGHDDLSSKKKNVAKKSHHKIHDAEDASQKISAERDEFKDKYLRGLAEMDNFRKRMKKEKEEFQKYVLNEFFLDLLQIYDNLERALKAKGVENDKGLISGVEMIRKQFLDLLKKYQVLEIDALGKHFDPAFHEALSKEEREGITQPVVLEIYQKGFTYNGKLLRPAMTKVAIPSMKKSPPEAANNPHG
jgi:molecular chaperone GrpE